MTIESVDKSGDQQSVITHHALEPLELSLASDAAIGQNTFLVQECSSTNDLINDMGQAGFPHGSVIVAVEQTKGRGRRGAKWFSNPDALEFSLLLRPSEDLDDLPFVNVLVAYAVLKTFYQQGRLPAIIKWPNDILVSGKKICGVMSEMRSNSANPPFIAVGCGINLNTKQADLPKELRSIATSLFIETGETIDHNEFMRPLFTTLSKLYENYLAVHH